LADDGAAAVSWFVGVDGVGLGLSLLLLVVGWWLVGTYG
jgi:hypothetical protein